MVFSTSAGHNYAKFEPIHPVLFIPHLTLPLFNHAVRPRIVSGLFLNINSPPGTCPLTLTPAPPSLLTSSFIFLLSSFLYLSLSPFIRGCLLPSAFCLLARTPIDSQTQQC
jgi:hypothetical protein